MKRALAVGLCLLLAAPLAAVASPPRSAAGLQVPVEYHKLDNGLKVVISRDTTAPIATVAVYYNIGFRIEPRDRTGFAHLFEHMMFQASENLGKMEFARLVQGNGGVFNGSTRFDFTNYYEVVPANVVETVLWAEADRMRGLAITQENLTNQQGVVTNEVKVNVLNRPYGGFPWLDTPQYANTNWHNAHNFYGDLKDLDAASLDDVKSFFEKYYAPSNAALVVVGDVDPVQTLAWIRKYFGPLPKRPTPQQPDISEPRQEKERRASKPDALATRPALAASWHMPPRNTPEYYAMGLVDQILVQGKDSRLYQALVQDKGLTGDVAGGINLLGNQFNISGPVALDVYVFHDRNKSADQILAAVDGEVQKLQMAPVDQAILDRARVKVRSALYDAVDGFFGFGRADLLASYALFDDDPSKVNAIEAEFAKVTPALIQEVAREYLRTTNRTVLVIDPKKDDKAADAVTAPPRATPPPPAAAKGFQLPAPTRFTLPNGMRATLVQWGSTPKVTVELAIAAGNGQETAEQVWLADLTGALMREGTSTRTGIQISEQAAQMGGSLDITVGADTTEIATDVLSEFGPQAVSLVADVARNPKLPESELARLKTDKLRDLAIAKTNPQQLALEKFRSLLYAGHAYGRLFPSEPALQGYTLDQVRTFHAANFGAARAHIYVVGRFTPAEVEKAIRDAFTGWAAGPAPVLTPPHPRSARGVHLVDRPGAVQSTLIVGMPVIDPTQPEYVPLVVTNTLLGGYFSSRMTANLREQKGYTYSPFSQLSSRRRDTYWAQNADVTTAVTGPSLEEIFAEIDRLQAEAPSEAELQSVKNYAAGTFVLNNSTRGGIINQLEFVDLQGLPETYLRDYVSRVNAVTPAAVQQMARKYITDDEATIVVVGDRKTIEEQVKPYGPLS